MKYIIILGVIVAACLASPSPSSAEQRDPAVVVSEKNTGGDGEDCATDDRRCRVDRGIDQIERTVREADEQYRSGDMWKMPEDSEGEKPSTTKYGTKALKTMAQIPNYAMRIVTWPIALVAHELIKTGAIRTIVDIVSNDDRTLWVYPKIELGFGDGFGGGIGIRDFDLAGKGYDFSASYVVHINLNQEAHIWIGKKNIFHIADLPVHFRAGSRVGHFNKKDYYGIGADTPRSDRASFGGDGVSTGGWLALEVFENASVRAHCYFDYFNSESGSKTPSVEQVFTPAQLPAFGESLYYANIGFDFVHDDRDSEIVPSRGGYRQLTFSRFQRLGSNAYSFNQLDLQAVQFFPVWRPRHMFVVNNAWTFQYAPADGIPFYRLARLDVDAPLRGFDWGRFRDRSAVVFNVEYRFPVWNYLDGQFFFDTGRVFNGITDFSFKHFKYSGGVGMLFRTTDYFLMRAQIAYGGEGVNFLFKTSQAF